MALSTPRSVLARALFILAITATGLMGLVKLANFLDEQVQTGCGGG